MPCWPPSHVPPLPNSLVGPPSTQTFAVPRIFMKLLWSRSEKTSVSSSGEYSMWLTWQAPVVPAAVRELTMVLHGAARRAFLDVVAAVRAVRVEDDGVVGEDGELVVLRP